jgi:hypothetical protein
MSPSDLYIRYSFSLADYQENADYDSNGDEIYHGYAQNLVLTTDPFWVIAKFIYTPTVINGATVNLMTHVSFLRGQIWANRTSIVFP